MAKSTKEFLYGLNPAFEALRASRRTFHDAYITNSTKNSVRLNKLIDLLEKREISIEYTEKGRLTQLAKSHEHQGVVLRCSTYPYVSHEDLFEHDRIILVDNVEDPQNVGSILRSAEVFGYSAVALPCKGVPEVYPSVVKVSVGASEHMQICRERSANQYARYFQEKGYKILSLDAKGKTELMDLPFDELGKHVLVIGGEDKSVGQFIINMSDHVVRMQQFGKINSLNASVAASISMHALATKLG